MKKIAFSSIRRNLTFWFLSLALMPLIVAMIIAYNASSNAFEGRAYAKLSAIRDLKVMQVENWISARLGDFRIFAQNTDPELLNNAITMPDTDPANQALEQKIRTILHNYQKNYIAYEEIYIINFETGVVDISTNPSNEGHDKRNEPIFLDAIKANEIVISPVYYSSETGKNSLTFSAPVYKALNENSKIIGVLVANIDLTNSLYTIILNKTGLGETGETLLVNKERLALNELRWYNNAPLQLKISAEPAVYASQGKTGIIKSMDYRGVQVLAAYTFIPQTNWGFVCKQDLSELNAPSKAIGKLLILLFIISALVILSIVYFVSKTISSPILRMNRVAQKIGAGDFTVRNKISSSDELGSLALSYNKMAEITESKIKIQQGVVDISETMIGRANMKEFGTSLLKRLMKITEANMSTFYILNEGSLQFEPFASIGANEEMLSPFSVNHPQGEFGNALSTKNIFHLKDIPNDTVFKHKTVAGKAIPKEIITIPVVVENMITAIISLVNIKKFHKETHDILKQSWININTSYSNLISNERTRVLSEHLSMINRELEAQTEELQEQSEELQNQTEELQSTSEELRQQNLELEAQKIQVEAATKLKSEFLSNMSHELRTPLNSIMALSRVLIIQAKEKLNEEENNYLEIVERNGKHLLSLINDILDLSKIEAGKMEINPVFISVEPFLQIVKENIQTLSEEKSLILNLDLETGLPQIETDEMRLHQVLTNILGNAVKFTDSGRIDISAQAGSETVLIKIKDTGIGISKADLPGIFEEFRQVDGTSARQYEGTGLGLAIARKIINILGGDIHVESELGKGTTFSIRIPIKWHEKIQEINKLSISVMIVDDNEFELRQISKIIESEKIETIMAIGGKDCLRLLETKKPDILILDMIMPDLDGFMVLEEIRKNKETRKLPVIIVTSKDLTKEEKNKLSGNVSAIITKSETGSQNLLNELKRIIKELEKSRNRKRGNKKDAQNGY